MEDDIKQILNIIDCIETIESIDAFCEFTLNAANGELNGNKLERKCDYSNVKRCREVNEPQVEKPLRDNDNPIECLSNGKFFEIYKLSKRTVLDLLQMINYGLIRPTNKGSPVSPLLSLLITLRFFVSGSFHKDKSYNVSQPTISRIIRRVSDLIAELHPRFIKIPDKNVFKTIADKFFKISGFPNVIGCVGSTHIAIKSPVKAISDGYLNEKGYHSFRVVAVCGPNNEFFELISRWPGATHENKIFNISNINQRFEYQQLEGVLLADRNYAIRNYVLTPKLTPHTVKDWSFNISHKKCYCIHKSFEIWKKRFKCLQHVMNNKEETIQSIITATGVLHNIAIQRNENLSDADMGTPITEVKGKGDIDSTVKLPLTMVLQEPIGLLDRDNFIEKYF